MEGKLYTILQPYVYQANIDSFHYHIFRIMNFKHVKLFLVHQVHPLARSLWYCIILMNCCDLTNVVLG